MKATKYINSKGLPKGAFIYHNHKDIYKMKTSSK